jgi:hypothetical protein
VSHPTATAVHGSTTEPTTLHPSPCPPWCRQPHSIAASAPHQTTGHMSLAHSMPNPQPLDEDSTVFLRAQLYQLDEGNEVGWTRMYIAGETDVELNAEEADIFITQMQAFVDTLRILRRQMG